MHTYTCTPPTHPKDTACLTNVPLQICRDIYYQSPGLFGSQNIIDSVVDNVACMLQVPRWKLHIVRCSGQCPIYTYSGNKTSPGVHCSDECIDYILAVVQWHCSLVSIQCCPAYTNSFLPFGMNKPRAPIPLPACIILVLLCAWVYSVLSRCSWDGMSHRSKWWWAWAGGRTGASLKEGYRATEPLFFLTVTVKVQVVWSVKSQTLIQHMWGSLQDD